MPMYNYMCEECGIFTELVSYEKRDEPQPCFRCGDDAPRTWKDHKVGITNASFVDGTGRFDNIRIDQSLRKAKAQARARGDIKESDKIDAERKKANR